jgi:hypothetical protein
MGGSIAYGKVPKLVHIVGYWHIHKDNPNFHELTSMGYERKTHLKGKLYKCSKHVAQKITLINENAENKKYGMIRKLLASKNASYVSPYINIDGCEVLHTSNYIIKKKYDNTLSQKKADKTEITVQKFDFHHNFTSHGPIILVDAWGVAAFEYRAKESDAHKILFCENDDTSFPVIFNKRPICPRPALKSTVVENGKLTVYKPNVQSVRRKAYHCFIEYTEIVTYVNFIDDETIENYPLVSKVKPVTAELCNKWIKTKKCDITGLEFKYLADFNNTILPLSETRRATNNPVKMKYVYLYEMEYTIANCIIDIGYIRTTPPFKTLLTPWGYVPNDFLYADSYKRTGGEVIVWNKFKKDNLCNYVPITSIDAKRITYNSKDFLEQDPHPGATEMYHFVSDSEKSVYTSDDTQITDADLYNCITKDTNQTIYVINNGMVLSWEKGSRINEEYDDIKLSSSERLYHPHHAFNELTVDECDDGSCTGVSTVLGGDAPEEECDPLQNPECRQSYAVHRVKEVDQDKRTKQFKFDDTETTTPLFAIVDYLRVKFEEYQNEDVIRRAQAWCENQQHLYDMQLLLARISPSVIVSSYLNRPSYAQAIGNGIYSTHYCQPIKDYIIVDNLFVNNTEIAPNMGGKTYIELYKAVGVTILPNRCFTMPIIIFTDTFSIDEYRIGQLHHDQTVSTISFPFVEECKLDRYFFHAIDEHIYVFQNYKMLSKTAINNLFDHASRLKNSQDHLHKLKNNQTSHRDQIDPLLENTQFIDIYTKYESKLVKPVVIGFKNTELYSYRQKRRMMSSFEDLIAYTNEARFDDKRLDAKILGFRSDDGGYLSFSDVVDSVSDGVKYLTDAVGDTLNYAVGKAGGVAGNLFQTADQTLSGLFRYLSNGFVQMGIIVAILAIIGLFAYYFIRPKLLSNDDEYEDEDMRSQFDSNLLLYQQPQLLYTNSGIRQRMTKDEIYSEF